jgi:hypothetical protein
MESAARFVVIGSPRTGSSHLTERLRSHPGILCHGEVFHPKNLWVYWPKRDLTDEVRNELLALRQSDPGALVERIFSQSYGRSAVGFKIFTGHCDEILDRLIADPSVRKIVLLRKNVLANFSSYLAAGRTATWGTKSPAEEGGPGKIVFKEKQFVKFYHNYTNFYKTVIGGLNANGQAFQLVHYEDINDSLLFSGIVTFVGANPTVPLRERRELVKQNSSDILSRFANPGSVRAFLREHGLLDWLHEGQTTIDPDNIRSKSVQAELG